MEVCSSLSVDCGRKEILLLFGSWHEACEYVNDLTCGFFSSCLQPAHTTDPRQLAAYRILRMQRNLRHDVPPEVWPLNFRVFVYVAPSALRHILQRKGAPNIFISPRQRLSERPRGAFELATGSALRPEHDGHLRRLVLAVVELWLGRRQRLHGQGLMGLGETAGRSAAKGATKAGLIGLPQRLGPS